MTTIKSTLGWLFGIYKGSPVLQGLLAGLVGAHIVIALIGYFMWFAGVMFHMPCR